MNLSSIIDICRDRGYFRYLSYTIIVIIIVFFLIRNSIVRLVFDQKCKGIKNRFGLVIDANRVGFSGLRTVFVEKLYAIPEGKDTILTVDRAEVELSLTDIVLLKINPLKISLAKPKFNFVGENDCSNYHFLIKPKIGNANSVNQNADNQRLYTFYKLLKAMFGLTTAEYHITDFSFSYRDSTYTTFISIPDFESASNGINTLVDVKDNGNSYSIKITGETDKIRNSIHFKAFSIGSKKQLPLLFHKFGMDVAFDTAELKITANKLLSDDINLEINSSVRSFEIFSSKLSDQAIKINHGAFDFNISLSNDKYFVDSTSSVSLNGVNAKFFIEYFPIEKYLSFYISTGEFLAQTLFESLPEGLFLNLKGIKTKGTIDYSIDFGANLMNPDSIIFEPNLKTKEFSLVQFGSTDFSALNDTFSHKVYNEGKFVKTILLDYSNKEYRSFNQISPFIRDAVVTSEDGGFYNNNGIDIEGLRYAISENIKQKRFARGGSTITMQLIKNLYLNHNKNLFRKVEEYIIVWLIGNQQIVSKERILEIYLNIIEWGPNIYGVAEACQYYFQKDPADVTLDEAIYLASVIPRPTKFKYLFEKDGNLKSFMEQDFSFVSNKMYQRGMITEEQLNQLTFNVSLAGPAKNLLRDTTSYLPDSIILDEIRLTRDTTLLLP